LINDDDFFELLKDKRQINNAYKKLIAFYQQPLYWHIRKLLLIHEDTNDVLQNTFLKVYKNIQSFKRKSSLKTWMYSIAYNEAMTFLNKKNKKKFLTSEEANNLMLENLQADVYFEGSDIQLKFQKALVKLPKKQREVFQMKYFDELKFREISEILGTSEGALKSSYHLAVKKLENYLINN